MSETNETPLSERSPLETQKLFSKTIEMIQRHPLKIMAMMLAPPFLLMIFSIVLLGLITAAAGQAGNSSIINSLPLMVIGFFYPIGYVMSSILVTQLVMDEIEERQVRFWTYLRAIPRSIFPAIILSVIAIALTLLGSLLFIIPGLLVWAAFFVFIPALVIEREGFSALARSTQLTKGYRWPIMGCYLLLTIAIICGQILLTFILAGIGDAFPEVQPVILAVVPLFYLFINSLLVPIFATVLYARLTQIKYTGTMTRVIEIFE